MKKITLLFFALVAFSWQSNAQSTINITTSGGAYTGEKWVNITDMPDGAGTQVWGQGDGTQCNGSGLINQNIVLMPGTYYVNCYDQYDDGWDGTLITVSAYGSVLGDNGGLSPDDGEDTDLAGGCEGTPEELEASFVIVVSAAPCDTAVVSSTNIIPDCGNNQYYVEVTIDAVGDASQINDGTDIFDITGVGVVQAGPYAFGVTAALSVEHTNAACDFSLGDFTMAACPPVNDDCSGAIALTLGMTTSGATLGATGASGTSCNGTIGNDVWYTVVGDGGDLTIIVDSPDEDSQIGVFETADCSGITLGSCDYSIDPFANPAELTFTSVDGATYYIQVGAWLESGNPSDFDVVVTTTSLATQDFDNGVAFTYYPNPVNSSLSLKAQNNIQNVSIYNMLGQEVLRTAPNSVDSMVDMSALQSGAYFVKVSIDGATETVRVIKN